MKITHDEIDLRVRQSLIFTVVVTFVWKIFQEVYWVDKLFIISMSGFTGYFTNYLAIKMLFHPKQGKILGWEGLVPKNKARIARSLAENIQNQLLSPDIIISYINRNHLIEHSAKELASWIDEQISEEPIRKKITHKIVALLKERGPIILEYIFKLAEENFIALTQDPKEIERIWFLARVQIASYIYQEENRTKVVEIIRKLLKEGLPEMSHMLDQAMNDQIEMRGGIVSSMGRGIKQIVSLDAETIERLLERFINEPKASEQILGILDLLVNRFLEQLNSKEAQQWVSTKVSEWAQMTSEMVRNQVLPRGVDQLEKFLDVENNWQKLDQYFLSVVEWLKVSSLAYVNSEDGKRHVHFLLDQLLHQLDVKNIIQERIMALDMDQFERLILDNTGGNMVVIQYLGGILGVVLGLVQVDLLWVMPLILIGLTAYINMFVNQSRIRKEKLAQLKKTV